MFYPYVADDEEMCAWCRKIRPRVEMAQVASDAEEGTTIYACRTHL